MLSKEECTRVANEFLARYGDMFVQLEDASWYVRDGRRMEFNGQVADVWHYDENGLETRRVVRDLAFTMTGKMLPVEMGRGPMLEIMAMIALVVLKPQTWVHERPIMSEWHRKRRWRMEDTVMNAKRDEAAISEIRE